MSTNSEKSKVEPKDGVEEGDQVPEQDPRFHQPLPSPFKRAALVVFTLLLFCLAISMRKSLWTDKKPSKVIYASRYSKEHKFRPAASPIITETLKDGRIRIRGGAPTATPETKPAPKRTKTGAAKRKAKKSAKGKKSTRTYSRESNLDL